MAGKKISAVLITKDEEDNIPRALRSVSFADEIIVLDTGSTDRTVEICRAGGARVEVAEWRGYVAAKNAVADLAGGDWLLSIDADEEVTPELREEIEKVVTDPRDKTGFFFPRRNHYLGRWVRRCGWYPDYQLRLWRRGRGRWVGGRVHERVEVDGLTGRTKAALNHFTYSSIDEHLRRISVYADLSAHDKFDAGKRAGLFGLLFSAPWQFIRLFILRGGMFDGVTGLAVAGMGAYYAFLKKLKLWELQTRERGGDGEQAQ